MKLNYCAISPVDTVNRSFAEDVSDRIPIAGRPSPTEQAISSSQEDIAHLAPFIRDLRCDAIIRGVDGTAFSLIAERLSSAVLADEQTLSAPIYDAEGALLAWLEITPGIIDMSGTAQQLLRTLILSAVRAMTERWFRICYRRYWIVAAVRQGADASIVLAVDRALRLVGADRHARELLEARGGRFDSDTALCAFFQLGNMSLRGRRYGDSAVRLVGSDDGAPWSVLMTPPEIGVTDHPVGERALVHTRPRLHTIKGLAVVSSDKEKQSRLSSSRLRYVAEYVDAHLDAELTINELASNLKLSPSHFARSFRNAVGMTPHGYVMRCRLMRAQQLLMQTELPLTEIALTAGFSDQSHLCRRVHQHTGLPPKAFREQHRQYRLTQPGRTTLTRSYVALSGVSYLSRGVAHRALISGRLP